MNYDLTDLRLFVAIAEERNLTRGAARAYLAPSSASHRLRRLEEALNTSLFERQTRGLALTRAGEALLRNARQVLASIEQMHANLSPFATGIRGHVSLWANTHATHTFLPDDLAGFLKQHPQVSVSLEERTSAEIVVAVANGEIEVGVLADSGTGAGVELAPYRQDRLVLIVPAGHVLAARDHVGFAEVLDQALAGMAGQPQSLYETRHGTTMIGLVEAGLGVAAVPLMAMPGPDHPILTRVPLTDPQVMRSVGIIKRRGRTLTPAALELERLVVEMKVAVSD